MAHNTTYHDSLKCAPTEILHGRTPYNALDLKFANLIRLANQPTDIAKMIDEVNEKYKQNAHNTVNAYHKYRKCYDRKASAQRLKVSDFVFLLKPKYENQSSNQHSKSFHLQGSYKVTKVLSNSKNIIRQIGTNKTQCVHQMHLQLFWPQDEIEDIQLNQKKTRIISTKLYLSMQVTSNPTKEWLRSSTKTRQHRFPTSP